MGLIKLFGWVLLVAGIGTMVSPLISSATGFAIANLNVGLPQPQISFSMTTFVIGGLLALVGLFIVRPEKRSVIENM